MEINLIQHLPAVVKYTYLPFDIVIFSNLQILQWNDTCWLFILKFSMKKEVKKYDFLPKTKDFCHLVSILTGNKVVPFLPQLKGRLNCREKSNIISHKIRDLLHQNILFSTLPLL